MNRNDTVVDSFEAVMRPKTRQSTSLLPQNSFAPQPTFPFRNVTGFLRVFVVREPTCSSSLYLVVLYVRRGRPLAGGLDSASSSRCATIPINCDIWQFTSVLLLFQDHLIQMAYRKSAMDVYSTAPAPDPSPPTASYPGGTKIAS